VGKRDWLDAISGSTLVGGVSGMVIIDLKTKKVMNSFQGIVICCFDPHRATWGQLF